MKKAAVCRQDIVAALLKTGFDIVLCNCFVAGGINMFSGRCGAWKLSVAVIWRPVASPLAPRAVCPTRGWEGPVCVCWAWERGVARPGEHRSERPALSVCAGLGERREETFSPTGGAGWHEDTWRNQHRFQRSLTSLLLGPLPFC